LVTSLIQADHYGIPILDRSGKDLLSQAVTDLALHQTAQWAGTVGRVVSGQCQPLARGRIHYQAQSAISQALGQQIDLQLDDVPELFDTQWIKEDHLIEAVQELWLE